MVLELVSIYQGRMDLRESLHVQRRAMKMVKGLENKSLWGAAETTGVVYSGEEETQGGPYCSLQLPERKLLRWGLVSSATSQVK